MRQINYSEFKLLPRPEYDEFMSKLAHAVNHSEGAYQFATLIMKVEAKDLPFQDFIKLPKPEHDELISTMCQNVLKDEEDFERAVTIVESAECCGMFRKIRFGKRVTERAELPIPKIVGLPGVQ